MSVLLIISSSYLTCIEILFFVVYLFLSLETSRVIFVCLKCFLQEKKILYILEIMMTDFSLFSERAHSKIVDKRYMQEHTGNHKASDHPKKTTSSSLG